MPSSPIDPVLGQGVALAEAGGSRPGERRAVVAQVADPRARRGVRHRLATVRVRAVGAVLAGAGAVVAVAEGGGRR